jgi:hypothetical protein
MVPMQHTETFAHIVETKSPNGTRFAVVTPTGVAGWYQLRIDALRRAAALNLR